MNIFVLNENPNIAAEQHCDKHVVKMILETCQILCSSYYKVLNCTTKKLISDKKEEILDIFKDFPRKDENGKIKPYGLGYINHICTRWAYENDKNFIWTLELGLALCNVYENIYNKQHSCKSILQWINENRPNLPTSDKRTSFVMAMPDKYKSSCPVKSYQLYYIKEKHKFAKWKNRKMPEWFIIDEYIL